MHACKNRIMITMLALVLLLVSFSASAMAQQSPYLHEPSAGAMAYDLVGMRPLGFAALVGGSVLFVVSLPFSALGRNVGEAGQALVVKPAKFTFSRPLGDVRTTVRQ